jgi:hypothetical protein
VYGEQRCLIPAKTRINWHTAFDVLKRKDIGTSAQQTIWLMSSSVSLEHTDWMSVILKY